MRRWFSSYYFLLYAALALLVASILILFCWPRPRYAVPGHFWTFAEQGGGDPAGFIHACKHFCPDVEALLLRPGEGFTVQATKDQYRSRSTPRGNKTWTHENES